jgi:uncharacterized membrane protein YeaQ/YmgE (transglycosylase-associated protein family)
VNALIIQLISGTIGGNVAGIELKNLKMGVLLNSIAGTVSDVGGDAILATAGVVKTYQIKADTNYF